MYSVRLLAVLLLLGTLPGDVFAQSGARLRASVSGQSFIAGDYGNTDVGQAVDVALLFGKGTTKGGIAFEYGEYTITGEPEAVVDVALDALVDIPIAGGVYMDLRFGANLNGWDVGNSRYTIGGLRGGGALGFRLPFGGAALDIAATGSYMYGMWGTVGSNAVSEYLDEIDVTGSRVGARIGLTLNPGVGR